MQDLLMAKPENLLLAQQFNFHGINVNDAKQFWREKKKKEKKGEGCVINRAARIALQNNICVQNSDADRG